MKKSLKLASALFAVAVLAASASAATGGATNSDSASGHDVVGVASAPAETPTPSPAPTSLPAELQATFGVFRREAGAQDRLDAVLAARVDHLGSNPELARLAVPAATQSGRYYVAPGPDGLVCTFDGTGSGGCLPVDVARTDGSVGTDECPAGVDDDTIAVHGLVPDGVDRVELSFPHGQSRSVTVSDNMWFALVPRSPADRPHDVSWDAGAAQHAAAIPFSPDVSDPC